MAKDVQDKIKNIRQSSGRMWRRTMKATEHYTRVRKITKERKPNWKDCV